MTNFIYTYFILNKYTKWYFNIINNASTKTYNGYTEIHHILPKSLGGSDNKNNLITLSAREHFICHYLLTKMTEKNNQYKMLKAFMLMKGNSRTQKRYFNSTLYQSAKENFSKFQSKSVKGKNNPNFGKTYVSNWETKTCIKINVSDLQSYLDKGWYKYKITDFSKYTIHNNKLMTINRFNSNYKQNNKPKQKTKINKQKIKRKLHHSRLKELSIFFDLEINYISELHIEFYSEFIEQCIWVYDMSLSDIIHLYHPTCSINPNDYFRSFDIKTRSIKDNAKLTSKKIKNNQKINPIRYLIQAECPDSKSGNHTEQFHAE